MLFNSYVFWVFFAAVALLYYRLGHRAQNRTLLLASYVFYGCWDWRFLSLIALSTVVDYICGRVIEQSQNPRTRRTVLGLSIVLNLGTLAFFKYFGFFTAEFDRLLTAIGLPALIPQLDIVLPVGISFYTFQTMSYTIDVYRGDCQAAKDPLDFALYVAFFPQLVAGPIERASRFLPQVLQPRTPQPGQFAEGLYHVVIGLFKKVFVADTMAVVANGIFSSTPGQLSGLDVLLGVYAFAFQIYGDFSGYSSIARGVSRWLGFSLMENFRRPYFAQSPSEFWQRWHISLSGWLRDYLYIPLGGNRRGSLMTYRNLMLTMLLGGLWHGAAWTFVLWGAYQGLLLCGYRLIELRHGRPANQPSTLAGRLIRRVVLFQFVCLGWLLFRAESVSQVIDMLTLLATDWSITPLSQTILGMLIVYAGPLLLFDAWLELQPHETEEQALLARHWTWRAAAYSTAMLLLTFLPAPVASEFIYFQF